mmetsp:Transcript_88712/g.153517  ORF Transcript_88712/g.153517 Transcript_88712/m.153517 type:complete len:220 (-) Transcript_88712:666-1325(-)
MALLPRNYFGCQQPGASQPKHALHPFAHFIQQTAVSTIRSGIPPCPLHSCVCNNGNTSLYTWAANFCYFPRLVAKKVNNAIIYNLFNRFGAKERVTSVSTVNGKEEGECPALVVLNTLQLLILLPIDQVLPTTMNFIQIVASDSTARNSHDDGIKITWRPRKGLCPPLPALLIEAGNPVFVAHLCLCLFEDFLESIIHTSFHTCKVPPSPFGRTLWGAR